MIPIQLTLKNFLSYRDATLDFSGLHTACICGANGAGKSSLLEAITWAIWGESRAPSEEEVIHTGSKDVRVDFTFINNQQTYRVIRSRIRGHGGSLEFQLKSPSGFIPLTGKGMRATQEMIIHHLRLDYDTFVNSAYLRQGKADEFMLRSPNERKQILADLLKLSQYEELAEQAKEYSRDLKIQSDHLDQSLELITTQLGQQETIAQQQAVVETQIKDLEAAQALDNQNLQSLQAAHHQRQTWEQQLSWHRQQYQNLTQDSDRLRKEWTATNTQLSDLQKILAQEAEITTGYNQFQSLQAQEEVFNSKSQLHLDTQQQRQQLQNQLTQQINELNLQLKQLEGQLEVLRQSRADVTQTLNKTEEVEAGLARLQQARNYLIHLDNLQLQIAPILQRRTALQTEIARAQARLMARFEELRSSAHQLELQQKRQPELQQMVMQVAAQIEQLEKKQVYQKRVHDKGLDKRSYCDRLKGDQKEYTAKLAELAQKLQMLQTPDASCPLCDRPMNEEHGHRVLQKTQTQQQELQQQLWIIQEQLTVSEQELQTLRQEYAQIAQELSPYNALLEQRGQLLAQLKAIEDIQNRWQQTIAESAEIEQLLNSANYAPDIQAELQQIEQKLQQFNYDEKDHALARNELERHRWAEIKQGEIKQAQRRLEQIDTQIPEVSAKINQLRSRIEQQQINSELQQQIAQIEQKIIEIGYERSQHDALRIALRQHQSWQMRYQQLVQAQDQYPVLMSRSQDLASSLHTRSQDLAAATTQMQAIVQKLEQTPDTKREIQALEQQLQQRRRLLDSELGQLGRLQQRASELATLQTQYDGQKKQLQKVKTESRVYLELAQAFGKNGIQAMMIENVLPQLEAQTNSLLARLSANQLHVQFVTQKTGKNAGRAKKAAKLIDTLDILIADARGTRPYETYSGGEAFRINFAIRLALARMLAQRAGTALQMLIIDEGFGTQDQEGCDRLVAAINAIASDFACILTVTHMPQFKEAFQNRIEVSKTQNGSQIRFSC